MVHGDAQRGGSVCGPCGGAPVFREVLPCVQPGGSVIHGHGQCHI